MAYNFKSIADVEVIVEPDKSTNVLIEENGIIKKAPKTVFGGENSLIFEFYSDGSYSSSYKEIYEAILSGKYVVGIEKNEGYHLYYPVTFDDAGNERIRFYDSYYHRPYLVYEDHWMEED